MVLAAPRRVAPGFVVWVRGLRAPVCQWWLEMNFGLSGEHKDRVISYKPVDPSDVDEPLDRLALLYPVPTEE